MNAVAKIEEARPRSVLVDMATRYGMEPAAFEATVRSTVVPNNCSKEQFAAFLLVAKEYRLNPLTKEIYAFPAKGGGIQPIVSIDGWARIINERPELTGIEFADHIEDGKLFAITAKIYRKDRAFPIAVTEYMSECRRSTDTWKQWPARMLRHKALIQCARYAFGFSGIVDPDEYERAVSVISNRDERPDLRARLPGPGHIGGFAPSNVQDALAQADPPHDPETGEVIEARFAEGSTQEEMLASEAAREPDGANNPAGAGDEGSLFAEPQDPLDWAIEQNQAVEDAETVAAIDALAAAPGAQQMFESLSAKSPAMAKALDAAMRGKRKALADKERGQ